MENLLRRNGKQMKALKDRTLLYVGIRTSINKDEDLENCRWVALKKLGLKSLCMILRESPINLRLCKKMKTIGIVDEYNVEGLVNVKDGQSIEEIVAGIMKWLNQKQIQVDSCSFSGDFIMMVGGRLCKALGVPGINYESARAAYLKDNTQSVILKNQKAAKYGVPSYSVESETELLAALDRTGLPVVMKPISGEGSVGVKILYDGESCKEFYKELTIGIVKGVLVMEYLRGTKYAVNVVVSNHRLIGGAVVQKGPAKLPLFLQTSVTVPGDVTDKRHQQLVEAAYRCCLAVGLEHGVYDVDLICPDGDDAFPKHIEINPRPGGSCLTELIHAAYGIDLVLVHNLLCCGFELEEGDINFAPQRHVAAYSFYLHRDGAPLTKAFENMVSSAKERQIKMLSPGWETAAEMINKQSKSIRQCLILMSSSSESRYDAIDETR